MERAEQNRFVVAAVIACYNVARYLPEFLGSLEAQTYGVENVQFIFVDDGSTDDTLDVLRSWAHDRPSNVVVLTQENQWVAAARNAGLPHVAADWVTFADPDDVLDIRYFEEVVKFVTVHGGSGSTLLATHQMRMTDDNVLTNTHPLRGKFSRGSRIVDLHVDPVIQLSVNSAFFRTDLIRSAGLQFDGRVRPVFEDAHFIGRYLLMTGGHILGLLASAKYHYRTRSDGTSLMQTHFDQAEKYTDVLRHGHLDLLELAASQGEIPRWLENTILYDLFWYFKNERALQSLSAVAPPHVFDEFHGLVKRIVNLVSDDAIISFDIMGVEFVVKHTLLVAYGDSPVRPVSVRLEEVDETHQLVKLNYWFSGDLPSEFLRVDDATASPVYETVQEFVFYGRPLLKKRILWLQRGRRTSVRIDGGVLPVIPYESSRGAEALTSAQLNPLIMRQRRGSVEKFANVKQTVRDYAIQQAKDWVRAQRSSLSRDKRFDRRLAWRLRTKKTRAAFEDAWVFMDRNTDANDNAEHLYRHVSKNHPEINSWFVLERTSTDWSRLEAEGFRLVAYKSVEWYLLLLHAKHLASSHIDQYVVDPLNARRFGKRRFRYSFLQHGVTNYDISRWVNSKPISLFVVVTPQERAAIAGPSPYAFSDREVVQTGFPRHDELLRKRRAAPEQDLIVIMPTWRKSLAGSQVAGSNERLKNPAFMESDFARNYVELLRSDRLAEVASSTGKRLAFMPHPNIRPYLADFDLPDHITILDFAENNVQEILARAAVFVTDYSSLGFDAAFLDVPVVYFQFDAAKFFDGTHVGRRGYFDYERDGFGPVRVDVGGTVEAVRTIALDGFESEPVYRRRTAETFVTRDEKNSERTFQAMRRLDEVRVSVVDEPAPEESAPLTETTEIILGG